MIVQSGFSNDIMVINSAVKEQSNPIIDFSKRYISNR